MVWITPNPNPNPNLEALVEVAPDVIDREARALLVVLQRHLVIGLGLGVRVRVRVKLGARG